MLLLPVASNTSRVENMSEILTKRSPCFSLSRRLPSNTIAFNDQSNYFDGLFAQRWIMRLSNSPNSIPGDDDIRLSLLIGLNFQILSIYTFVLLFNKCVCCQRWRQCARLAPWPALGWYITKTFYCARARHGECRKLLYKKAAFSSAILIFPKSATMTQT